jgi:hypothetical protein
MAKMARKTTKYKVPTIVMMPYRRSCSRKSLRRGVFLDLRAVGRRNGFAKGSQICTFIVFKRNVNISYTINRKRRRSRSDKERKLRGNVVKK